MSRFFAFILCLLAFSCSNSTEPEFTINRDTCLSGIKKIPYKFKVNYASEPGGELLAGEEQYAYDKYVWVIKGSTYIFQGDTLERKKYTLLKWENGDERLVGKFAIRKQVRDELKSENGKEWWTYRWEVSDAVDILYVKGS